MKIDLEATPKTLKEAILVALATTPAPATPEQTVDHFYGIIKDYLAQRVHVALFKPSSENSKGVISELWDDLITLERQSPEEQETGPEKRP